LAQTEPLAQPPKCPECGSLKSWKDGLRYACGKEEPVQRYLCRSCGYRFSQPKIKINIASQIFERPYSQSDLTHDVVSKLSLTFKESVDDFPLFGSEYVASHKRTTAEQGLNTLRDYNSTRRVCASESEAKNLAEVETTRLSQAAGATITSADMQGKIVEFAWWLKKKGRKPATITSYSWYMKTLLKNGVNILDPEAIKEFLAKIDGTEHRKYMYTQVYATFLKMLGKTWEQPSYKLTQKFPYIPTEQDIDRLIAASGKKLATALQTAKETAFRVGEIASLKWINLDSEKSLIICNDPEKNSQPRILKISSKLNAMLNKLPKRNEYIFGCPISGRLQHLLTMERKTILRKLQDPKLANIHFHTLRHWKATMLYHETKNPMLVKEFLGHKSLLTTQRYIHIEQALFKDQDDKFTVMAVKTPEEIKALLEVGFEYICQKDDLAFLRKRK